MTKTKYPILRGLNLLNKPKLSFNFDGGDLYERKDKFSSFGWADKWEDIHSCLKIIYPLIVNLGNDHDKKTFNTACNFIGLLNETKEKWLSYKKEKANITEAEIVNKIDLRNKSRVNKDYKEADNIRNFLLDKGVLIEDKDGKTVWKLK